MFKMYNDLTTMYYCSAFFGFIAISVLLGILKFQALAIFSIYIIWVFACSLLFNRLSNKRTEKNNALFENCQVVEYINAFEKILKKNKDLSMHKFIKVNLSSGYINNDEHKRALELLLSINRKFPDDYNGLVYISCYYSNLFLCYAETGDLDNAAKALDNIKNVLKNPKLKSPWWDSCFLNWQQKCVLLDMYRGNYNNAEKYFLTMLDIATTTINKVSFGYYLSQIYIKQQNYEKSKEYLDFVIKYGGDTYFLDRAKESLIKIEHSQFV